jgi:serine-type D-Ala-D-Ala endopeptidase (penicillin-binding protein 7)
VTGFLLRGLKQLCAVLLASTLVLGFSGAGLATAAAAKDKKSARGTAAAAPKKAPAAKRTAAARPAAVSGKGLRIKPRGVKARAVRVAPPRPSYGQLIGLRATDDALDLQSSVALVVDQDTDEVLFSKNPQAVLPIASITKLMTALVVTEAALPLDEMLEVSADDVAATAGSRSRLQTGTQLSRGEMLHLSLMASENRAAHVLGRNYPGGIERFVSAMNAKAQELGMQNTRYVEPTGLSSNNQSSAHDLARLVRAAAEHAIIGDLSTSLEHVIGVGRKMVAFRNTNGLVRNPEWDIGLQKTGYIAAAGRCVVMQTQLAGRKLIMVLLDSAGKYSRIGDAERIRHWLMGEGSTGESPAPQLR